MKKKVLLLGATGSIGTSTIEVIRNYPENFSLVGVSCYKNLKRLEEIIEEFKVKFVFLPEEKPELKKKFPFVEVFSGKDGLKELIFHPSVDIIIIAISGIAGLYPTFLALQSGKKVLSANKESFVAAGDIMRKVINENKTEIIPIDSEHNAIFNILIRVKKNEIKKIILTASGGPFLNKRITKRTSIKEVLSHPTWKMGRYITVNSATMMNKGFEVIEAHFLFEMEYEKIDVLIHPQSLIHGIVELNDGTNFMVISPNDMKFPIALSLFYPEIPIQKFKGVDLNAGKRLELKKVDYKKFPLLNFCYRIGEAGGLAPAVLNSVNEYFVEEFLNEKFPFFNLPKIIMQKTEEFLARYPLPSEYTIEDVLEIDKEVKKFCKVSFR